MLTIGELATAGGTTTRTIRHYHSLGLLPEPARRANGYREYDIQAVLRLLRIRRLTQLGLSLREVGFALVATDEQDLRGLLGELAEDLRRQEATMREARARVEGLLAREHDLVLPSTVADMLVEVRRLMPQESLVRQEAELLELLQASMAPDQFDRLAQSYRSAITDPAQAARAIALAHRFELLATGDPHDSEVADVAAEMVALGRDSFPVAAAGDDVELAGQARMWAAYRETLAPAQQECLSLVEREYAP